MLIINRKVEEKKWKYMGGGLQHIYISHKHLVAWSQIFSEKIEEIAVLIPVAGFPGGRGNLQVFI